MDYLNDGQTYHVNVYEHACICGKTDGFPCNRTIATCHNHLVDLKKFI